MIRTAIKNIWVKRTLVFLHDIAWVPAALACSYLLRFNFDIPANQWPAAFQFLRVALPVQALAFWVFGCYRGIWRFASIADLLRILRAVLVASVITSAALLLYTRFEGIPRSIVVLYPILLFMGVSSSRVLYRILTTHNLTNVRNDWDRALIVGAGAAGEMLIRDLQKQGPFLPVAIVDGDRAKRGTELHGVRVLGGIEDIPDLVESLAIKMVLIAMPSAPRRVMDEILHTCIDRQIPCRTLPSLLELADGRVEVSRLRPVTVEDLLGREPVELDARSIDAYLTGKVVAVTGGGGSIGSELCRQVMEHKPASLLIVESSEYNLYAIDQELRSAYPEAQIIPALVDIRMKKVMDALFRKHQPNVVFHAAAYKHVPLVEHNILEGIRNNIVGTRNVVDAAVACGVSKFVQVSTDKTVNPTNIMGATKRIAEIYCQSINRHVNTEFVTTRFGNVLGSAGSVVPLFERQIKKGGPVTITHPDITRFFMTIPEAASLILQAGAMGHGGEIFVLDMGKPVRIQDMAENLIRLSGLQPNVDIKIEYIGLRPGEKMHEELFYDKEELTGTEHPKLLLANSVVKEWAALEGEIFALDEALNQFDETAACICVQRLVPELKRYVPGKPARPESGAIAANANLRIVK